MADTSQTPLPDGWVERVSSSRGKTYYFNERTNETTWVRPIVGAAQPSSSTQKASARPPSSADAALPPGWDEARTPDGRLYYKNHVTKSTQWTRPAADQAAPEKSQQAKRARSDADEVRVRHLLIKHEASRRPESSRAPGKKITLTKESAVAELRALRETLVKFDGAALDAEFSRMSTERSDCSSGNKGGDLGFFTRGKMQPPFEKASFDLAIGELSGIVDTDSGVHVILRIG